MTPVCSTPINQGLVRVDALSSTFSTNLIQQACWGMSSFSAASCHLVISLLAQTAAAGLLTSCMLVQGFSRSRFWHSALAAAGERCPSGRKSSSHRAGGFTTCSRSAATCTSWSGASLPASEAIACRTLIKAEGGSAIPARAAPAEEPCRCKLFIKAKGHRPCAAWSGPRLPANEVMAG